MILAGNQPYFFPYIGQFMLIKHSDKFIIFDTAQFVKRGWIHRNRILNHDGSSTYINVAIKKASVRTPICDTRINNKEDWQGKILEKLKVYSRIAPYYSEVISFLRKCFEYSTDSLSKLNEYTLKETCKYLHIPHDIEVFSEMNLKLEEVNAADEWGLNMAKAIGAKECINAPGGIGFYDRKKYLNNNINLKFIKPNLRPYSQGRYDFIAGLSIIDIMMFNSIEEINIMLDDYEAL